MKPIHAALIWCGIVAVLFMVGYTPPANNIPISSAVIQTSTSDIEFYEDAMQIVISYKADGLPLQVELIKRYGENSPRAILRTRISDNISATYLLRLASSFSENDLRLGNSSYSIHLDGMPMSNHFQSIITGSGSYDCLMFGSDWIIDKERRLITVVGNTQQKFASQK